MHPLIQCCDEEFKLCVNVDGSERGVRQSEYPEFVAQVLSLGSGNDRGMEGVNLPRICSAAWSVGSRNERGWRQSESIQKLHCSAVSRIWDLEGCEVA
jgi:hypothetical protein